jgi:hypothetical protein
VKENVSSQEKPSRTISKPQPVTEPSKVIAPETVKKVDTKETKAPELKKHKKASKFSLPVENKSSGDSPDSKNQLRLNIGKDAGVTADQIREAILGETGVPESIIGKVELQAKHSTIDIAAEKANAVMSKMKRANIAGKRVKAKLV